ncbi:hypothetical protein ACLMJK_001475 [Lecanora helva]
MILNAEALNNSGCVWAGYSSITEAFKQRHFDESISFIIDDGVLRRQFDLHSRGDVEQTWVLASHMAVGFLSINVGGEWYNALKGLSPSDPRHSLRYRSNNETIGSIQSWAPAVRSQCNLYGIRNKTTTTNEVDAGLEYPLLPEHDYSPVDADSLPIDGILIGSNQTVYPHISAYWIPAPEIGVVSNGSTTRDIASAYLNIIIPYDSNDDGDEYKGIFLPLPNVPDDANRTSAVLFACSVDARWAVSNYDGGPIGDLDQDYVQRTTVQHKRPFGNHKGYQYNFLPIDDGSWRRVQIDTDWLDALTPSLSSSGERYNALAYLLEDVGLGNSTGTVLHWSDVPSVIEGVISTLVADGMSRQGYAANGGNSHIFSDASLLLPWNNSAKDRSRILANEYTFPAPDGEVTKLHCNAWDYLVGLIVLAATSRRRTDPATHANIFDNASAGIERYRTLSTSVRVRAFLTTGVIATHPSDPSDLKILFGDEGAAPGYEELSIDQAYG